MTDTSLLPAKNATRLIARAAGVRLRKGTAGRCRACGEAGHGENFEEWVKPTFTDWDKLRPGEIVCQACLFCFCEQSEPLAALLSKAEPQRFRNYSHFVVAGKWSAMSKGGKRRMLELLLQSPSAVVIAVSGQKHLAFRCPAGWWQIEEHTMRPAWDAELFGAVELLYQGGLSKADIQSGRYANQKAVLDFGLARWAPIENGLKPRRGTALFELCLFLAQRKEDDDDGPRAA